VYVVHPGICTDTFDPGLFNKSEIRNELGVPENVVLVGMAGRMTPGKGHEEYLRAARKLIDTSDVKFLFLVAGTASRGEEAYEANIRGLAGELGLAESVRFMGFVRDIPRFLAALDILAFPSHEESFGLGLTEAMAMEIAVVAGRSAGVLDIVADGETGMLFPPKDHDSLATSIMALAIDPVNRRRFGQAGRERVKSLFSIEAMIDNLEKYYSETPSKD
jgi:glycosyltransferase involved in cell wall biosynthesis